MLETADWSQVPAPTRVTATGVPTLQLPAPETEVVRSVKWGRADAVGAPAYWKAQVWIAQHTDVSLRQHRLANSLAEEVAACLLGGYGIPAEVGLAAFERLRGRGLLSSLVRQSEIRTALEEPLLVRGRQIRYRFAAQRSRYLSTMLKELPQHYEAIGCHREFRDSLRHLPGVGYKTASWVTRNWLDSDRVAILDVHVCRAGILAGIFSARDNVARDYEGMEARFLELAEGLGVRASLLDAVIWRDMRALGSFIFDVLRPNKHN